MEKQAPKPKNWIRYYDDRNILDEITDESVDLVLGEHLRDEILSGSRFKEYSPGNPLTGFVFFSCFE